MQLVRHTAFFQTGNSAGRGHDRAPDGLNGLIIAITEMPLIFVREKRFRIPNWSALARCLSGLYLLFNPV